MIQTGCPLETVLEIQVISLMMNFILKSMHDKPGVLSMANSGVSTNEIIFVTHVATPWLDNSYLFGQVVEGQNIQKLKSKYMSLNHVLFKELEKKLKNGTQLIILIYLKEKKKKKF